MFADWQWRVLELPPRHFSWRVRGNPLYWSIAERETLEQDYDLLMATSMADVATLRGLVPSIAALPTVLYFHENQFDFPQDRQRHGLLEAQMVSLYSALAADQLAFNSAYNRDTFLGGVDRLLDKLPDHVPAGIVAALNRKSVVLPVPLLEEGAQSTDGWPDRDSTRPLRILWSARFEHDKGGEELLGILQGLERESLDFQLAITGQQFRNTPQVFERIAQEFEHRLVQFGYLESPTEFRALQTGADIVLSTARHEFQGLAVMQAVSAGCLPVVPDRLAYPEFYPAEFRYLSCPEDPGREAAAAVALILSLADRELSPPDLSEFTLKQMQPRYQQLLHSLQDSQPQPS
jgi:glycosyltransferase involved in cell wall biosynthesis